MGAVLRPATAEVLAVASFPLAVDYLRLSAAAAVLAVASLGLLSATGLASVVFFSSLGLVAAVAAVVLVAAVVAAGFAPAFFSTTWVMPPALILSLRLSSMGSALPSSAGFLAGAVVLSAAVPAPLPAAPAVVAEGFLTAPAAADPPPIF